MPFLSHVPFALWLVPHTVDVSLSPFVRACVHLQKVDKAALPVEVSRASLDWQLPVLETETLEYNASVLLIKVILWYSLCGTFLLPLARLAGRRLGETIEPRGV